METLLKKVLDAIAESMITESEGMYLIYLHNHLEYPIEAESLLKLTKLKYVVGGKVGKILFSIIGPVGEVYTGTIQPQYINNISRAAVIKICKMLCVIDKKTKSPLLPGSSINGDTVQYTAKHYLKGEGLIAYQYVVFLFLFPVRGKNNRQWEKHFTGFEYTGAKLRNRSMGTAGKFKRIAKQKDMGAFLYGTYLYIKSCIQGDRTYIKTIHNYLDEYEDWYLEALELIEGAEDVDQLFKDINANEGRINVILS